MVDFTAGKFKSKVLYKVELYLLIGVEYDSRNTVMSDVEPKQGKIPADLRAGDETRPEVKVRPEELDATLSSIAKELFNQVGGLPVKVPEKLDWSKSTEWKPGPLANSPAQPSEEDDKS